MTDVVIIQSGNQVEPQSESAAAIAIPFRDDAKDFQMPNHVLDQYPAPRQLTVGRHCSSLNGLPFGFLSGVGELACIFCKP